MLACVTVMVGAIWMLQRGEEIRRKALHDKLGGVRQGGISPSTASPNIFLFTDPAANAAHGYVEDRWVGSRHFEYCGEGQSGHQDLRRCNRSILEHAQSGKSLRVFSGSRGPVRYVGEFTLDVKEQFYVKFGKGKDGKHRRVVIFRLQPIGFEGPASASGTQVTETVDSGITADHVGPTGATYEPVDELQKTNPDRVPFTVDPDEQDRALQAHATAQNVLATWVADGGLTPLKPTPTDPKFDLAGRAKDQVFVAEVKSILPVNEVRQIRLGLGQVLDYAHQLSAQPVLYLDRRPVSDRWLDIAAAAGVRLAWPADCSRL